jgi:type IV secretory pathway VirJ component
MRSAAPWLVAVTLGAMATMPARAEMLGTVLLRGHAQTVRLYGTRGSGDPVVVSSGDGGWIHLGPSVAATLASHGYFVIGFDTRAYLQSFTSGATTLHVEDVPGDYKTLAEYAGQGSTHRAILIGVSEGAGLSVLAASHASTRPSVAGVLTLGLPLVNELAWRWRDSVIYVTHGVPNEPTFTTAPLVDRVAPLPLAAIHSSHDEFVPVGDVQRVLASARQPSRLWIVDAWDHRFRGNVEEFNGRLLEALIWIQQNST